MQTIKIGLISVSDRAAQRVYTDKGIPGLKEWIDEAVLNPKEYIERLIPDEQNLIEEALIELSDQEQCCLILTTGGTGPYPRDVTPDATLNVADRVIPGFGEQMRQVSLHFVPTAILSRQVGVIRKQTLILNLPGRPSAIKETLGGVMDKDGNTIVQGVFSAVPLCVDAIGGPFIETNPNISRAFRPKF